MGGDAWSIVNEHLVEISKELHISFDTADDGGNGKNSVAFHLFTGCPVNKPIQLQEIGNLDQCNHV